MSAFTSGLLFVAGTLAAVAVLAALARKLLGLRVGVLRTLVAGGLGLVGQTVFALTVKQPVLATIQFGVALLVAVVFLVVAEAVVPTGALGWPNDWLRAARRRLARTRRYSQITKIAVRHGLGPHLWGRGRAGDGLARALRMALEDGGVTFVKLGQLVATRGDLLPADFIDELSRLHSQVTPVPWERVRDVLAEDLGRPIGEVFAEVDPEPMAAAAIAQVHRARLLDGSEVVIKIQRPGIRTEVVRDLDILSRLARTLHNRTRWGAAIGVRELADGFAVALREELDFRVELRNTLAVAAGEEPDVVIPTVHPGLSSARVLVLDRLDGVPIGQTVVPPDARVGLADALLRCLLRQIMVTGVFHADPHPGNVLLLSDGRLALLDYGSVGRLDATTRAALQRVLLAADSGDPAALRDALLELVVPAHDIDEAKLERALGQYLAAHLSAGGTGPDLEMFTALLRLTARFDLAVPPEVAAVFRCLVTLDGTLTAISPGFDLVEGSRTGAFALLADKFTATSLRRSAADEALAVLPMLRRLPRRLDRITGALERGQLSMRIRLLSDGDDRRAVTAMLDQVLTAFLGGTTGIMAVLLLGTTGGPSVTRDVTLFQVLGYNLLVLCGVLVLRVLFLMLRR
ncbi:MULTISPECIES: ABC1 kinase family protein [Actinokineospora]|uniref:Ubiquinone biosynthesis protein UbiB n=1 Tax=Actinokineospora fastidiosa TaxID=1816 RepID=A0A918LEN3_9PSEU|nr:MULTISPECIES: AarF/ABC1/UbiB kinase family protein [Actinokineospora]UVS80624.1 putative ubiquinone biosynthesis protein UbiB [Actinokineospora sp. UTMC 2448]GGS36085.1 ubiquinone biosynthesis protein UbiB [Actinokineospora fastidiosa]